MCDYQIGVTMLTYFNDYVLHDVNYVLPKVKIYVFLYFK